MNDFKLLALVTKLDHTLLCYKDSSPKTIRLYPNYLRCPRYLVEETEFGRKSFSRSPRNNSTRVYQSSTFDEPNLALC
jgi:hypothetical protein